MRIVETDHKNKDLQYLTALVNEEYFELFGEIVLEYAKHNKLESLADVVLIYIDNIPVACGGFREQEDTTVEIKRVFVRKEYRRHGLASRLMKRLEDIARQKGYTQAVLQTGSMMDAAIALYKSLGYEIIENYGAFDGDANCACMKKEL